MRHRICRILTWALLLAGAAWTLLNLPSAAAATEDVLLVSSHR